MRSIDTSKTVSFSGSRRAVPASQHPFAIFPYEIWVMIVKNLRLEDCFMIRCLCSAFESLHLDLLTVMWDCEPLASLREYARLIDVKAAADDLVVHKHVDAFVRGGLGPEPERYTDVFAEWEYYDNTLEGLELFELRDSWLRKAGGAKGRSHSRDHAEWEGAYLRMTKELKRDLCKLWAMHGKQFQFSKAENAVWRETKVLRTGCGQPGSAKKGLVAVAVSSPCGGFGENGRGRVEVDSDDEYDGSQSRCLRKNRRNSSANKVGMSMGKGKDYAKRRGSRGTSRHSVGRISGESDDDAPQKQSHDASKPPASPGIRASLSNSATSSTRLMSTTNPYSNQRSPALKDRSFSTSSSSTTLSTSHPTPLLYSPSASSASPTLLSGSPQPKSILRRNHLNMSDIANLAPPFSLDSEDTLSQLPLDNLQPHASYTIKDANITTATTPKPSCKFFRPALISESSPFFEMDADWMSPKMEPAKNDSTLSLRVPKSPSTPFMLARVDSKSPAFNSASGFGSSSVAGQETPPPLSRRQMRMLKKQGCLDVHPNALLVSPSLCEKGIRGKGIKVAKHNKPDDLWCIIDAHVYNLTDFADVHPGSAVVLHKIAGKDATTQFFGLHRHEVLKKYKRLIIGKVTGEQPLLSHNNELGSFSKVPYAESLATLQKPSPFYNQSHLAFKKAVRAFCDEHIVPDAEQYGNLGKFPDQEILLKMGSVGLYACRLGPGEHLKGLKLLGGVKPEEFDYFHEAIAHEEITRAAGIYCYGEGLASGMMIGAPPILKFGPAWMKERLLPQILSGEKMICLAISEPGAGSDVAGIECEAVKTPCGKFYIVNGTKKWITNGSFSQLFTTAVRTGKGPAGISMLLIERSAGVSTENIKTSGTTSAGTAYVTFENVKVPVENLIGKEGQGFAVDERWAMVAGACSAARQVVEECFKWATQRKVFGKPLIEQPVIRYKLGQMISELEAVQSWYEVVTYQMTKMSYKEQTQHLAGPIALLKYRCTRMTHLVSDNAVQIFGGRAITRTGMGRIIEQFQRVNKFGAILGGAEEVLLDLGVRQAMKVYPKDARL
ncbi:UNVERIFIED_CONTAM: hypothetical protein HDU68_005708 [Siphonaria sp. JEL0065]|nr:hypothetical protein HDU68_005708 [Siphonaria sp. JEL0065]